MAGSPVAPDVNAGAAKQNGGRMTVYVLVTCVVAATGGLIFGYDIGISGGVTSMESFLEKFFPDVYRKMSRPGRQNDYCRFDSQVLTAFTSSLYLAGLVSSFVASAVTRALGRNVSISIGGATFLVGAAVNAASANVEMLIVGRILLGFGVGFANQAVPIYLSEMAPARLRGALNIGFQLFIGIGVVSANLINYGTAKIEKWGWRLSLGGAAVPALIMTTGSVFLPNTPSGFIERGQPQRAMATLQSIRGSSDVQPEFDELIEASEKSKNANHHPFRHILKRKYRAHLVMATAIPLFQQLTGINVIAFYAPVLFKTIGFGGDASLMAAVILGVVNLVSIVLSIFIVDRYGRRVLFMEGGIQMIICQVAIAGVLGEKLGSAGEGGLSKGYAGVVVFLVCAYAAGFGWSWGPLSWLVPSEIFPLEIRSAGQSINVSVNLLVTFVLAQVFLSMLCRLKFYIFLFYAGWVAAMTVFVYLFLPETKNVPMEEMSGLWKEHWFWRRFVSDEAGSDDDVKSTELQPVENGDHR